MAQKRLSGGAEGNETVIDVEPEDITELQDDFEARIATDDAELGADRADIFIKYKAYKLVKDSAEMDTLFECAPGEIPMVETKLIQEYMQPGERGKFELRRLISQGGGKLRLHRRYRFSLLAPRTIQKPETAARSDLAEMFRSFADSNQRMFEQMQTMMNKATGNDQTSQLSGAIQLIKELRGVMGPQESQGGALKEALGIIREVRELAGDDGGGGRGGASNFWDVAKAALSSPFFNSIADAVATARNNAAMMARPQPMNQLPPGTVAPQPAAPEPSIIPMGETMPALDDKTLSGYISMLLFQAKNHQRTNGEASHPEDYASIILDNVPPELIVKHMLQPDSLAHVYKLVPEAFNYQDWFQEMQKCLADILFPEQPEPAPVPEPEPVPDFTTPPTPAPVENS